MHAPGPYFPLQLHTVLPVRTTEHIHQAYLQGSWYIFLEVGFPQLFRISNILPFCSVLPSLLALGSVPFRELLFRFTCQPSPQHYLNSHTLHFTPVTFSTSSAVTCFSYKIQHQTFLLPEVLPDLLQPASFPPDLH